MAVNNNPIFIQTPRVAVVQISTANANRDGTGTIGTVLTAGANGTIVDHVDVIATGTTTAGIVRLFIHDGATARLWKEIEVLAKTPSATVTAFRGTVDCSLRSNDLFLQSGFSLRAATNNAEAFNVVAVAGDL